MALDSELGGPTVVIGAMEWLRGPAQYDRVTGDIVLRRARAEPYQPTHDDGMLFELAAVSEPSEAVAFVQRRGLLKHGPDHEQDREPFDEIREEASSLWLILRICELVARGGREDREASRELRDVWLPQWISALTEASGEQLNAPAALSDAVKMAGELVAMAVSERLKDVEQGIVFDGTGFAMYAWPNDLVSAAYIDLSNLMCTRVPMAVCPECRRVFVVEHGRQRYCSPTCSGRARNRKWRQGDDRSSRKKES